MNFSSTGFFSLKRSDKYREVSRLVNFSWFYFLIATFREWNQQKMFFFYNSFPYVSVFLNIVEMSLLKLKVPDVESLCFKFYDIKIFIKAVRVSPKNNMVFQIMDLKIAHATNFRAKSLKTKVFQKLQPMFRLAKFVFDLTIVILISSGY